MIPIEKITDADIDADKKDHEGRLERQVVALQRKLDSLADDDRGGLELLQKRVEIQLSIEELRVRFREADHAHWVVYGPLFLPGAAIVITIVSLLLTHVGWLQSHPRLFIIALIVAVAGVLATFCFLFQRRVSEAKHRQNA
jgi:hypothetical protein